MTIFGRRVWFYYLGPNLLALIKSPFSRREDSHVIPLSPLLCFYLPPGSVGRAFEMDPFGDNDRILSDMVYITHEQHRIDRFWVVSVCLFVEGLWGKSARQEVQSTLNPENRVIFVGSRRRRNDHVIESRAGEMWVPWLSTVFRGNGSILRD